jgi:hypothetical protein
MDIDSMLAAAAPARHLPLDGPDSPAAASLYQRITAQPPAGPPRRRPRIAVAVLIATAAAAAAAVALALLPGSAAPPRRGGQGGPQLAAWTVVRERHGLVLVTINELRDPAGLQRILRANKVPAHVWFRFHDFTPSTTTHLPPPCQDPRMSDEANANLQEKIMPGDPFSRSGVVLKVRPSAIPHGIGLFIEAWAPSPGTQSGQILSLQTDLVKVSPQCTG